MHVALAFPRTLICWTPQCTKQIISAGPNRSRACADSSRNEVEDGLGNPVLFQIGSLVDPQIPRPSGDRTAPRIFLAIGSTKLRGNLPAGEVPLALASSGFEESLPGDFFELYASGG